MCIFVCGRIWCVRAGEMGKMYVWCACVCYVCMRFTRVLLRVRGLCVACTVCKFLCFVGCVGCVYAVTYVDVV